jgi:hypothetical protein
VKACRESVSSIIGEVDGFLFRVELSNCKYRPKYLHKISVHALAKFQAVHTSSFTWPVKRWVLVSLPSTCNTYYLHIRANIRENYLDSQCVASRRRSWQTCGVCPVPGGLASFASDDDFGTFLLPSLDVAPHTVVLSLGYLEAGYKIER